MTNTKPINKLEKIQRFLMSNELTRSVYGTYACLNVACIVRCKYKCYRLLNDVMKPFV
jgi:hypothetical protein